MNKMLCPHCDAISDVEYIQEKESIAVRGENIEVDSHFFKCSTCNNVFDDPQDEFDVLDVAYRTYRQQHNMLQPEAIKHWRQQLGLTQVELSRILGFGDVTINRYEGGKLQEESHDKAMQLAMKPINMLTLINGSELSIADVDKRKRLLEKLKCELNRELTFEAFYEFKFDTYPSSIDSGFKRLDITKVFALMQFFCNEEAIYKTKLNKLMFYVDFKSFKDNSVSITGLQYYKLPYGPVPDKYEYYIARLIEKNNIIINEGEFGEKLLASSKPDLTIFTDDELKTLIDVKKYFKHFSATKISQISHNESAYINTRLAECISYGYASELGI